VDKNTCISLLFYVYFICRVESTHWALKRLLQNSLGDLCSTCLGSHEQHDHAATH